MIILQYRKRVDSDWSLSPPPPNPHRIAQFERWCGIWRGVSYDSKYRTYLEQDVAHALSLFFVQRKSWICDETH